MEKVHKTIFDLVVEFKLSQEQIEDKEIMRFCYSYLKRYESGDWYQFLNGNGICELNKKDGTMITTVLTDEEFEPEFPLNCDVSISERCENGCAFCYLNCTPNGKEADIKKFIKDKNSFLYSLHEGTELALNGNEPLHKDLGLLLKFCQEKGVVANLTVSENTLLKHIRQINSWLKRGLLNGVGVSPTTYSAKMIKWCQDHPTAVIHTIAGITGIPQYRKLYDKGLKILILGYKDFGRGVKYANYNPGSIENLINHLSDEVSDFVNHFEVVSFDNLAISQLNPRNWLSDKEWETFYRGDDGHHTLYIDLVNETFAKNSIQAKENHKPLVSDIRDMLKEV